MNVVTAVIKGRHSVRKFKPDPIDESFIHDAIECAVHAPTAMNMQPWLIGIVQFKGPAQKNCCGDRSWKIHYRSTGLFCNFWGA